jgi:hypothetical protein
MANRKILRAPALALALVLAMTAAGCKDKAESVDPIVGMWVEEGTGEKITFSNGVSFGRTLSGATALRGTYSARDGTLAITVTEVFGGNAAFSGRTLRSIWYTRPQIKAAAVPAFSDADLDGFFYSMTGPYSINGNVLNWGGVLYNK